MFTHVHGLGYLAGQVFVATHHGLLVGTEGGGGWTWGYAGAERYDYMGFVQDAVDPGTFYSSGHPDDPRAFGGTNLGLRRSTDAGATWEQRSLKGTHDFHSLSAIPGIEGGLVGLANGRLMESRDGGLTWTNHTIPTTYIPFDVAVTDHHVYVTSADGLTTGHLGNASSWTRHDAHGQHSQFYTIAAAPDGSVMFAGTGNGRSGSTYRSVDEGHNWTEVDHAVLRQAAAPIQFTFDALDANHILAANAGGTILESRDLGLTWKTIRA